MGHPYGCFLFSENFWNGPESEDRGAVRCDYQGAYGVCPDGKYAKSWVVKKQKETEYSVSLVVHSRTRYRLAHLLEFGHAIRGGGRVEARPHLAAAEEKGIKQITEEIESGLQEGS